MTEQRPTILVVDDEPQMTVLISSLLEEAGFDAVTAADGKEGLEKAKSDRPDLILCDIQMPVMNGYDMLNAVKTDPELADIPFIFMTGVNTGRFDLRLGMDLGADDYLTKPFTEDALTGAIRSRLTKQRSRRRLFESRLEKLQTGIVLLFPNELHMLVLDILEHSQSLAAAKELPSYLVRQTAAAIAASGKRLGHLHENILLFVMLQLWAKDEAKVASLREERTASYMEVLFSIVDDNVRAADRKTGFLFHCTDAPLRISAAYFGKVMDEVVDNACMFSEFGTPIEVRSEIGEHLVVLSVKDRGRGMSADEVASIGSLLDGDPGTVGRLGTGMGLTIAKTITEIHGGSFKVESEPGRGTTVHLAFPKG